MDFAYFSIGLFLGIIAGLSPGPIFVLVISETLKRGVKGGIKLATVPLASDIPILLAGLFIIRKFQNTDLLIGTISIIGSIVLGYLAFESMTFRNIDLKSNNVASFRKGVFANFVNPHVYVNVFTVHIPLMLKASKSGFSAPIIYFSAFLTAVIGAKIMIAVLVSKSKAFLNSKGYSYTIRALGILLFVFAITFFWDGLKHFK